MIVIVELNQLLMVLELILNYFQLPLFKINLNYLKRLEMPRNKKKQDKQMDEELEVQRRQKINLEEVPASLIKKVAASKERMMEFLLEEMEYYLPRPRDCTAKFFRQVLGGDKMLLKTSLVKFVGSVP